MGTFRNYILPNIYSNINMYFIFRFMPPKMFDETGFSKKDFITLSKTMMDIDFSNTLDSVSCLVLLLCGEKDKAK